MADQTLSSLTNFALSVLVARAVPVVEFGAFAIAFAAYLIALGISRGVSTDSLTVRYSALRTSTWQQETAEAAGATLSVSLIGSVVLLSPLSSSSLLYSVAADR